MSERLDTLEAVAVKAVTDTYRPMLNDEARFWVQKGIEGMRLAVALEAEEAALLDEANADRATRERPLLGGGIPPSRPARRRAV